MKFIEHPLSSCLGVERVEIAEESKQLSPIPTKEQVLIILSNSYIHSCFNINMPKQWKLVINCTTVTK